MRKIINKIGLSTLGRVVLVSTLLIIVALMVFLSPIYAKNESSNQSPKGTAQKTAQLLPQPPASYDPATNQVVLGFDEPIAISEETGTGISLTKVSPPPETSVTVESTTSANNLIVRPANVLTPGDYELFILPNTIEDSAGTPFTSSILAPFTVGGQLPAPPQQPPVVEPPIVPPPPPPVEPLRLISTDPRNGAPPPPVPLDKIITITFNRDIRAIPGSNPPLLFRLEDDQRIPVPARPEPVGRTITLTPVDPLDLETRVPLDPGTRYEVVVEPNTVEDLSGINYEAPIGFTFRTVLAPPPPPLPPPPTDATPPRLDEVRYVTPGQPTITVPPGQLATNVPRNAEQQLVFNEEIRQGPAYRTILAGVPELDIPESNVSLKVDNNGVRRILAFAPRGLWPPGELVGLDLDPGFVEDLSGNPNPLIPNIDFRTVTAPAPPPPQPAPGIIATLVVGEKTLVVNGVPTTMDVAAYIKDNRTFIPVRFVARAVGVADNNIIWDPATKTVTLRKGDRTIQMTIGSRTLLINGVATTMDTAPEIVDPGRTMLPIRFVAEALDLDITYDDATKTVTIKSP